ncbi:MAG: hypothetical protein JNK56_29645, partial [Myxococcales bacterium]|nr:hypothetical protein [Myxococcales bacterium]
IDARAVGSLDDTTGVPDRLVCHGMLVDLGPAGRYNGGSDLDSTPRLAIADSASAAIEEAFLDIGGGELFAVLRGGIDGELGGAAGLQALPHHLHAAGFDAAPVPAVPPTEYVATLLDPGVTPGPDFLPVLPNLPANTIVRIVDRRRNGGPLAPLGCPVGGLAQLRQDLTAPGLAAPVLAFAARKLALPRWHRPGTPVLHIEGHGRSFRHGHDGRMRADGRLPCRASGQTLTALELSLDIPSAGARITGPRLLALDPALARQPDFVRALVHEAALLDPVNRDIAAGVWLAGIDPAERTQARADAASRAFADATELWWSAADPSALPSKVPATVFGTLPVPFAVNPWRDPWLPLFAEFDYSFTPHDASNTAALALDPLEPRFTSPSPGAPLSGSDRQALSSAPPSTLQSAIARVQDHFGKVPANQAALDELVVRLASLDMLTVGFGALDPQLRAAGHALRGGALGLPRLRLVDTFGRTRPPEVVPPRLLPPRLTHWARVQTRLVDAQARDAGPLRSPLAGVLVFDAVEQALEIFTATGAPLGQLRHDRGTHLAAWEPAPGRDGVPLGQLPATLAELAAAMLAPPAPSTSESAVAAVLKVLDRARIGVARRLTSDDPRSQLLRRPVLLMHACLTLELAGVGPGDQPDPAAPAHKPGPVPVRLGSLDQLDDGLLGFFHRQPGSDTWKLHVVPAIASDAWPPQQAAHPIVDRSTTLALTPGVGVNVILLLDGPAAFHVQAGLLPRKRIETSELVPPRALAHLQS